MLSELTDKNADIQKMVEKAIGDGDVLSELLDGLEIKEETYRYNCHKVLMLISKTKPEMLYPAWDYLVGHLSSVNSYHKMSATLLLANIVAVDQENMFDDIFDVFYRLLDDRSMVVAYYVASSSANIIRAKPHLQEIIIDSLLDIDSTHHPTGRKEMIKTGIIETLDAIYEDYENKPRLMEFVEKQVDSESRKTAKTARAFIVRWVGN